MPSISPTEAPTTLLPTQQPSITGLVVSLNLFKVVTGDVTESELNDIVSNAEALFNVASTDVVYDDVAYQVRGIIEATIPSDANPEEITEAFAQAIADSLNVHAKEIDIEVDMENGQVIIFKKIAHKILMRYLMSSD